MRLTGGLPDYRFCTHTVTVYHAVFRPEFSCRRTVLKGVWLDERDSGGADAIGPTGQRYCFLLAPCGGQWPAWRPGGEGAQPGENWFSLEPGDRVLPGEGPEIETADQWRAFVPAAVPGLAVIREAAAKRLGGQVRHVEAQTEWNKKS